MKKSLMFIFLLVLTVSCQLKYNQLPDEEVLLKEELDKIDWTKVDAYPTVDLCDSLLDDKSKRDCFFAFITQNLQVRFNADTIEGNFTQLDTLKILVTVKTDSQVEFELYDLPETLIEQTKTINKFLHEQGQVFSVVHPAVKRGVPVTSQFIIPVVLNKQ